MADTALLILDVQQALFDVAPRPFEADLVVQRINQLSEAARAAGFPVIYMQTEVPGWLLPDSPGWQLQAGLQSQAGDHFLRKSKANAFLDSALDKLLQDLNIKQLIICGYASEFCIDSTVRHASSLGYTIILPADAHTTHDKEHLSAEQIRQHHSLTLSRSPQVSTPDTAALLAQLSL